MKAVVVDDSRAMRMILGRTLKEIGFEVIEAAHGREALRRLQEAPLPDVALVDWNMPEMNGFDFVRAVREDRAFDGVRLLMVSAETEAGQVTQALEAGADGYVTKPFTKDVLVDQIARLRMGEQQTAPADEEATADMAAPLRDVEAPETFEHAPAEAAIWRQENSPVCTNTTTGPVDRLPVPGDQFVPPVS